MRIEVVTTVRGLTALRPAWDALFAEAETASPFNSWPWIATWWAVFGPGKRLRIFVVRDAGQVIGIAPFYALHWYAGPLRLRVLRQVGHGNALTELQEILVASGRRADVVGALAGYFIRERGRLWDLMSWEGVACHELPPGMARLVRGDEVIAYAVRPLPGSWDALARGLHKSMRDNLKYYPRLLARRGHAQYTSCAATPQEIGSAVEEFLRLHHARARMTDGKPHHDRFQVSRHGAFLRRVAPALARQGMLRIHVLAIDGATVAVQLTLEHAGVLYIYYSGFDPAWRQYSVGMSVTAHAIRHGVERGLCRVNFLRSIGQDKERWGTTNAPVTKLTLVRDAPLARATFLAFALWRATHLRLARGLAARRAGGLAGWRPARPGNPIRGGAPHTT